MLKIDEVQTMDLETNINVINNASPIPNKNETKN